MTDTNTLENTLNFTINIQEPKKATLLQYGRACIDSAAQVDIISDSIYLNMIAGLACLIIEHQESIKKTREMNQVLFDEIKKVYEKRKAPTPCLRQFQEYAFCARFIVKNTSLPESVTASRVVTHLLNKISEYKSFSQLRKAAKEANRKSEARAPMSDSEKINKLIDSLFDKIASLDDSASRAGFFRIIKGKLDSRGESSDKKATTKKATAKKQPATAKKVA